MDNQHLHRRRYEDLAVEPRLGVLVVVLGQVPHIRQLLKSLEDQPGLLSQPVRLRYFRAAELRDREGREDYHVTGERQGLRLELPSLARQIDDVYRRGLAVAALRTVTESEGTLHGGIRGPVAPGVLSGKEALQKR